jgi:cytochrome c2
MPNFRLTDEETNTLVQSFMASSEVGPFETPPNIAEHLQDGQNVFTSFRCSICHVVGGVVPEGREPSELAPDLGMAQTRLRPEWILAWLQDPQKYQPGTRMPDFFPEAAVPSILNGDPALQVVALRNYIYSLGRGNQASIMTPEEAAWRDPILAGGEKPQEAAAPAGKK